MAVGSISIHQMLRHPYVLKVISRITATGNPLQSFYNVGISNTSGHVIPAGQGGFTWDIFDHTRQIAGVRASEAGPRRIRRQRVGTASGHLMRSYEGMVVTYGQIANMRPLGSPIGTLDKNGQSYVTKQIAYMTERNRNLREWCLSRMFRGGFYISISGDDIILSDSSGQIFVDFQHPAANRSQLAIGDAGANVIDTSWANTSADIITQFLNLNKAATRRTGLPIEHVWVNSTTLGYLLNNIVLQQAGGAAYRVWDSMDWKDMKNIDGTTGKRGFDVRFRAMPWVVFHGYDGVLAPPSAQVDTIPAASTDVDLVIPNNVALMTPAPGEWIDYATGTEVMQKSYTSGPESLVGFNTWTRPTLDPSGKELLQLDNFLPIAPIPAAWMYATVVF